MRAVPVGDRGLVPKKYASFIWATSFSWVFTTGDITWPDLAWAGLIWPGLAWPGLAWS